MVCTHWLTFLQTAVSYDNGVYTLTDLPPDCSVLWQWCVHTDGPSSRLQCPMTMVCTHWLTFLRTAVLWQCCVHTDLPQDCRVLWQCCVHTDWPSSGLQSPMTVLCTHWLTFLRTAESYDNVVYTLTDIPQDCRVLWQCCVHTDLPPDCRVLWQCCVPTDWPSSGQQHPVTMVCTHWLTFLRTADSHDDVHGGDDLLSDGGRHGAGVDGAVRVDSQVFDQSLQATREHCQLTPVQTKRHDSTSNAPVTEMDKGLQLINVNSIKTKCWAQLGGKRVNAAVSLTGKMRLQHWTAPTVLSYVHHDALIMSLTLYYYIIISSTVIISKICPNSIWRKKEKKHLKILYMSGNASIISFELILNIP